LGRRIARIIWFVHLQAQRIPIASDAADADACLAASRSARPGARPRAPASASTGSRRGTSAWSRASRDREAVGWRTLEPFSSRCTAHE
jgi:hypothetical protein